MVDGLILEGKGDEFCVGCAYGKIHRTPFPWTDHRERSTVPGDLVHTDLCGPMRQTSIGGAKYFVLFKDDATGFRTIECIKVKNEQTVLGCLKKFVGQLQRETGHTFKILRSDRGSEYVGNQFIAYLDELNVRQELTTSYTPEHNGAAERDNRTIVEAARSMLHASNIHTKFWGEAVNTAVYILIEQAQGQ
jgi:hypothetical protein